MFTKTLPALLVFAACSGSAEAPPDGRAYAEATRLAVTDPVGSAEICERVGGEAQAECLAHAAAQAAVTDAEVAGELCTRIEHDVWREECGFLVARTPCPGTAPRSRPVAAQRRAASPTTA